MPIQHQHITARGIRFHVAEDRLGTAADPPSRLA